MSRASGGRTVRTIRIGSFSSNAVGRRCGGVHRGCADPRVELVFRRLHAWTLEERSPRSQPVEKTLLCQDVSGRFRTCQSHRTPPPAVRPDTPAGSSVPPVWRCHPACAGRPNWPRPTDRHPPEESHANAERQGRKVVSNSHSSPKRDGFGRLIDLARAPVTVAKYGRPVVVVLSVEEYERLKALDMGTKCRGTAARRRTGAGGR